MANALDRIDRKILNAVQRNNRLTTKELARIAGQSAHACQRRLKRLRDAGVIEADVAIISPEAVGRPMLMLVYISVQRDRSDIIDRFKRAIRRTPEIMNAYYVTGIADFVLMISVRGMEEYEAFARRFFYENADIKEFSTMVVMDRTKVPFAVPVGE
ncbi:MULTISPECIES: Lrp/AsnC family transcriptional regulator [unclassified Mesorhizobium]|uniref:Lrp/AsnC family transcriptional regulator n=1 Tax=unclassified Mesorhizobium TaxID=325217 RepID=UPI00192777DB|nr:MULTISPECIES: Lrp/AsnC family transcriptional regulator [unclassified Mesorhizobium]BCG82834.1 putative HTH-type transcriptional regulator y4tD [Mesorhizobium sp. 113-3-3]BCG90710.1 putative HTH-type transcriptional regulator y4tD [Mesorhizobium sp. 113-3-9]